MSCDPPPPTDLFGLHSGRVLVTEAELGDGHVIQDDVEVFGPLKQLSADQQGNLQQGHVSFRSFEP